MGADNSNWICIVSEQSKEIEKEWINLQQVESVTVLRSKEIRVRFASNSTSTFSQCAETEPLTKFFNKLLTTTEAT